MTAIFHVKTPTFPQFRFEWHPGVKRVYLARLTVKPVIGEPIALEIETEAAAMMAVAVFLRGYREGVAGAAGPAKAEALPNIAVGTGQPTPSILNAAQEIAE